MKRVIILKLILIFIFISFLMITCSKKENEQDRRVIVVKKETDDFADENRLALVIGNSDYIVGPLSNPVNDARAIAKKLENLNFSVMLEKNKTQDEMKRAILKFGKALKKSGGVGLFYFGGHGMQVKGKNYLIPIDTKFESEEDVEILAVDVGMVLNRMENAKNRVNIIILDACRDNPFIRSSRSGAKGLAAIDAPGGTIIAYSTAPGSIAEDGVGENSTYTKYLLSNIGLPGLRIEDVFKNVRKKVMEETKNRQIPWESSSLVGDFYFSYPISETSAAKPTQPITSQQEKPSKSEQQISLELTFWKSIEKSTNPKEFEAYLEKFPKGTYSELAKIRLESLKELQIKKNKQEEQLGKDKIIIADNQAWVRVELMGTESAYRKYLQDYPSGLHTSEAKQKIKTMTELPPDVRAVKSKTRRVYKNNKGYWEAEFDYDIVMVHIPAGQFRMGYDRYDDDEKPVHNVYLDGYWIGKHEITVGQFKIFVKDTGYRTDAEKGVGPSTFSGTKRVVFTTKNWRNPDIEQNDNHPVVCISWNDASEFCGWISRKTGLNFHLPIEAQWEKACRAGTQTTFYYGDSISINQANFAGKHPILGAPKGGFKKTTPVGSYSPNGFGIYDMHGNAREWCSDWYDKDYYKNSPFRNPKGPYSGSYRVQRGGSWGDYENLLRCAFRESLLPSGRFNDIGFRLAMD